jgi:hypothetical protein
MDCQLTAVEPRVASTDDKIAIEGTFTGSVTVNFPGGTSVAATVLGPHRATVTVPAAATAGDLTVNVCGLTVGPLPFRRVSFRMGLGNFEGTLEQSTGARQTPKLVTPRASHTAAMIGHELYIMGGVGSVGALTSIEQASLNADGSLGEFTASAAKLTTARHGHTSVVIGPNLYVLGGSDGGSALSTVERATIDRDGALGPFATVSGVTLATARQGHTSIVVGNSLYVIGGLADRALDSVERATINADGSLEQFAPVARLQLTTARTGHSTTVVGRYLYVIGGTSNTGLLNDFERAPIEADGSLGPFAPVAGSTLSTPRSGHTTAMIGSGLYVVGGVGGGGPLSSVERAPLDADGFVGPVVTSPGTLTTARGNHATAIVETIYTFSGAPRAVLSRVSSAGPSTSVDSCRRQHSLVSASSSHATKPQPS